MDKNDLRAEWRKQHDGDQSHFSDVTVYMGSSYDHNNSSHVKAAEAARTIAQGMSERGIRLIYGGGSRGIMGIFSQAVLDSGGEIVGYTLAEFEQIDSKDCEYDQKQFEIVKDNINERKDALFNDGDVLIAMPGGIGTEEEIWDALGKSYLSTYSGNEDNVIKPIILVNIDGHYDLFAQLIQDRIDRGYASAETLKMFKVVADGEEALAALDDFHQNGPNIAHGTLGNVSNDKDRKPKP